MSTVVVGSSTFTITETVTTGTFLDGIGWAYVPSGTITVTAVSPAQTTVSGYAVNGLMKNPVQSFTTQGFDDRLTASGQTSYYDAGDNVTLPVSLSAGDTLWKSVYSTALGLPAAITNSTARNGIFDEMNILVVVDYIPGALDMSPICAHWSGKTGHNRIRLTDTLANLVATLPSYDLTGIDINPVADIIAAIDYVEPIYGITINPNTGQGGFQQYAINTDGTIHGIKYGRNRASIINSALWHLIGDVASDAQKQTLLMRVISYGIQNGLGWVESQVSFGGNGAHQQVHQFATLWAMKFTDTAHTYTDMLSYAQGNVFAQVFAFDSDYITNNLIFHTSASLPLTYYEHTLDVVTGNVLTCPFPNRGGPDTYFAEGLIVTRKTVAGTATVLTQFLTIDHGTVTSGPFQVGETITGGTSGHTATVEAVGSGYLAISSASGNFSSSAETITGGTSGASASTTNQASYDHRLAVEIDAQPGTAYANSDVVNFRYNPSEPEVGDVDWDRRESQGVSNVEHYIPSAGTIYRDLQDLTGVGPCKAVGAWHDDLEFVADYTEGCFTANFPSATNNWPYVSYGLDGHAFNEESWLAHWANIKANAAGNFVFTSSTLTVSTTV